MRASELAAADDEGVDEWVLRMFDENGNHSHTKHPEFHGSYGACVLQSVRWIRKNPAIQYRCCHHEGDVMELSSAAVAIGVLVVGFALGWLVGGR